MNTVIADASIEPPAVSSITREDIAVQYIHGKGLEIGALHYPLPVPEGVGVRYVDRLNVDELRVHYPELAAFPLIEPDIVDDGEKLETVPDQSQDFIIANHMLEHCEDPIGTLLTFYRVLKQNGVCFLAIPDKRFTFDVLRPVTPLSHLIEDHQFSPEKSRKAHYEEFVSLTGKNGSEEIAQQRLNYLTEIGYSIHFHVWTQREMLELFQYIRGLVAFEVELFLRSGIECIVVLRKTS